MEMEAIVMRTVLYALFLLFLPSCHLHRSTAADHIPSGAKLSWNQTITSTGGVFELGFFNPGNSSRHYIGIWYKKTSVRTVVWIANREKAISELEESFLEVSRDGNLVLYSNSEDAPIWSSNSTGSPNGTASEAVLLDTGNLVIRDAKNSSIVRWQSFDHPTDTWLPGAKLGMNKVTREYQVITAWKNLEDPAPGPFSWSLDPDGSNQFVLMWRRSQKYWMTEEWNGAFFSGLPQMQAQNLFFFKFLEEQTQKYLTYGILDDSKMTRVVMEPTGKVTLYIWKDVDQAMLPIVSFPISTCDVYSICGANGICNQTTPPCQCSHGFQPVSMIEWSLNDWSSGCVRSTNISCTKNNIENSGGITDGFFTISDVIKPANPQHLPLEGIVDCRSACLMNCACTAFSYANSCLIWSGDLWDLRHSLDADSDIQSLYIKLAASEIYTKKHKHKVILGVLFAVILATVIFGLMVWWTTRSRTQTSAKGIDGSLVQFRYSTLQQVTKNFSDKLGAGSFGSVFNGTLTDSTTVAVKKLENYGQGEKQFQTEVNSLGTLQHVNLVRLYGFCSEKKNRLLVYEYLPNGSLASRLFCRSCQCIDWSARYKIALETAKGLAYLHEECRHCIIHCDIKPENILLDEDYRPKVADFGLAKLLGRDFSRVLTTARGTIGYLAPEWLSGVPITQKVDVYSYGMMLFEIISGKRNANHTDETNSHFFPIWVAKQIREGKYLDLADEHLRGNINEAELIRACRVACWCIQDSDTDRPSMRQIVQILEGILEVGVPPVPLLLDKLMEVYDTSVCLS